MENLWANAKANQKVLHFKNFQEPEVTWEDALNFVYNLSKIPNENMVRMAERSGGISFGSVVANNGYFRFEESNLFKTFNGIKELMEKVNGGDSGESCSYYRKTDGPVRCSCGMLWHIQTLRFSISDHKVSVHNDPNDVLYWQLLGTSYWKINGDIEYKLEPGDLFYINKEDSHELRQEGPRAGIIIDNLKQREDVVKSLIQ
jgi:mannose-6-phosphate isomerase-like protein (cupin superfamily)